MTIIPEIVKLKPKYESALMFVLLGTAFISFLLSCAAVDPMDINGLVELGIYCMFWLTLLSGQNLFLSTQRENRLRQDVNMEKHSAQLWRSACESSNEYAKALEKSRAMYRRESATRGRAIALMSIEDSRISQQKRDELMLHSSGEIVAAGLNIREVDAAIKDPDASVRGLIVHGQVLQ